MLNIVWKLSTTSWHLKCCWRSLSENEGGGREGWDNRIGSQGDLLLYPVAFLQTNLYSLHSKKYRTWDISRCILMRTGGMPKIYLYTA